MFTIFKDCSTRGLHCSTTGLITMLDDGEFRFSETEASEPVPTTKKKVSRRSFERESNASNSHK
eukprot:4015401-Pyramimonas_sp.AAC.1